MRIFFVHPVACSFRPGWRAAVFLLALGLPGLFLSGEAIRLGVAETLSTSEEIPNLRRAVALDSADPKMHRVLGSRLCSLETPNLVDGIRHLRRATELGPYWAVNWSTLAFACEMAGDTACADQAFLRALSLSPKVPRLEWSVANHFLSTDRTDEALGHFKRLLELDPKYDWRTFRLCLRATGDPEIVFQKVLPANEDPSLRLSYVNFLSTQDSIDTAYRAWAKTIAGTPSFPFSLAQLFLDRELILGRGQQARRVWQDLQRLGVISTGSTEETNNLIFNGGFELAPLNAGLDWRHLDAPYLSVDFNDPGAYQGKRCLRLDFSVSRNDEYVAAFQFVPVAPNHTYVLSAYARSQNITSDSGPRLRVVDPMCPGCLSVLSETSIGTTPWHEISLRFTAGPQTQLVSLSVVRLRSRSFPMEITGSFWLDSVSLKESGTSEDQTLLRPAH